MPKANAARLGSEKRTRRRLAAELEELRVRLDALSDGPGRLRARGVQVVDRRGITRVELFAVDAEDDLGGDDAAGVTVRDREGEPAVTVYVTAGRGDILEATTAEVAFSHRGEMVHGLGLSNGRRTRW